MEEYIARLFNDPSFASVLAIVSIWYAFFLYSRPPKRNQIYFISMTNHHENSPRETTIVILNNSPHDLVHTSILRNHPFSITFKESIQVEEIVLTYDSSGISNFTLIKQSPNAFQFNFEILRSNASIVMITKHNSKTFMDNVWSEFSVKGEFINFDLVRDDFSDQMIYRAHNAEMPAYIATAIVAIVLSIIVNAFLKAGHVSFPYLYLLGISAIISFYPVYNFVAGKSGLTIYNKFWLILKQSRKIGSAPVSGHKKKNAPLRVPTQRNKK